MKLNEIDMEELHKRVLEEKRIKPQIYNILRSDPNIIYVQPPDCMSDHFTEDGMFHVSFFYELVRPEDRSESGIKSYSCRMSIKSDFNLEELYLTIRNARMQIEDPERIKVGADGYWDYVLWVRKLQDKDG